jgi:hypothetical protein
VQAVRWETAEWKTDVISENRTARMLGKYNRHSIKQRKCAIVLETRLCKCRNEGENGSDYCKRSKVGRYVVLHGSSRNKGVGCWEHGRRGVVLGRFWQAVSVSVAQRFQGD